MRRHPRLKLPSKSLKAQAESKDRWNHHRSRATADFYTVGYMGRSVEDLVLALVSAGVATVIDIRHSPVSMYKPDFSKRNLEGHLRKAGIDYIHVPDLGVPRDIRGLAAESGTRDSIWDWYDTCVVEPYLRHNLTHFLNAADHPVALMCVEADPMSCHRHRLSLGLEQHGLRSFDL